MPKSAYESENVVVVVVVVVVFGGNAVALILWEVWVTQVNCINVHITYPIFVSCFINWDLPRNFYWTSK